MENVSNPVYNSGPLPTPSGGEKENESTESEGIVGLCCGMLGLSFSNENDAPDENRGIMSVYDRMMASFPHPHEFFSTRTEVSPKTSYRVMGGFSILVYAVYGIAFIALLSSQLNTFTTDTVITATILGGDYECSMLSDIDQETKLSGSSTYDTGVYDDAWYNYSSIIFANALMDYDTCNSLVMTKNPCSSVTHMDLKSQDLQGSEIFAPYYLAIDSNDNVYVSDVGDGGSDKVFKYDSSSGVVSTIMDSNDGLDEPSGIAIDSNDDVYVGDGGANKVFRYDSSSGVVSTFMDSNDGLYYPRDIAIDSNDKLYVVDGGFDKVFKYDSSSGVVSTIMDTNDLSDPDYIAIDSSDNVYVSDGFDKVFKYDSSSGVVSTIMDTNDLNNLRDIAIDSNDDVYVSDHSASPVVFKYDSSSGDVSTIMDTNDLSNPYDIAIDSNDNVYVSDYNSATIFKYGPSSGEISDISTRYEPQSISGWYICDGEVQSTTSDFFSDSCQTSSTGCSVDDVKPSVETITGDCSSNGFYYLSYYDGDIEYNTSPTYESESTCQSKYSDVCRVFNISPPYSCSKKVYTSFFDALGTAFANSSVLLGLLVMGSGLIMTKWFALSDREKSRLSQIKDDNYS